MSEFTSLLKGCWPSLSAAQVAHLEGHYELLSRWNRRLNLTSVRDLGELVRLHYCESLFLASRLPPGPLSVLDVGSGAGFPGIPLAVLRPECSVTLAESHRRKAVFLMEATRGLSNVTVHAGRAEDLKVAFDWVVARAVPVVSLPWVCGLAWLGTGGLDGAGRWTRSVRVPGTRSRMVYIRDVSRENLSRDVPRGTC